MQFITILAAQPQASSNIPMLLLMAGLFGVFYFTTIRPQQKKAKEQKKFQDELSKGDKVITMSGIHGKIVKTDESTFDIEIANNTVITIEKSMISAEVSAKVYPKNAN